MATAPLPSSRNALGLRSDETIGLVVAGVAHVVIVVALAINALRSPAMIAEPERVVVSLAEDVGLEATATQIATDAQASVSDRIGEVPVPPTPEVKKPAPPKPAPPKPTQPKKPVVSPNRSSEVAKPAPKPTPKNAGASRFADAFKEGQGNKVDANAPVPASQIGSSEKASLRQAIDRQLRPHWKPPEGADAFELRTYLTFRLNPDGSLAGRPTVVRQTGVNDANRAQAGRHAELAIRAVQVAAPFDLPPKYYNAWKQINDWEFKWTPQ